MTRLRWKPACCMAAWAALLLSLAAPASQASTPLPAGPAVQINSAPFTNSEGTHVASRADGSYVAVWAEIDAADTEEDIEARVLASNGAPLSAEFQVNSTADPLPPSSWLGSPEVAADAAGNFVVLWVRVDPTTPTGLSLVARAFAADGTPKGAQFRIDTDAFVYSYDRIGFGSASIAMSNTGAFVVVWGAQTSTGQTRLVGKVYSSDGSAVNAQVFDIDGQSVSGTIVRTYFDCPAVAIDRASGAFVVSWIENQFWYFGGGPPAPGNLNFYKSTIKAQRYSASASPQGGSIKVDTLTGRQAVFTSAEPPPAVIVAADGSFDIAWVSETGVYARQFTATGAARGKTFLVSASGLNDGTFINQLPGLAIGSQGQFVATWASNGLNAVFGQAVNADGSLNGASFQINPIDSAPPYTRGYTPSVAIDASGSFLVIWASLSGTNLDDDTPGIFASPYASQ